MTINIFYKNITPDEPLEVFVNEKIGGLEKFLKGPAEAKVEIGMPSKHHRSGPVFYAEVNLKMGGELFRAATKNEDLRNAIVEAKNELHLQIKKFKERRKDLVRQPAKK